MTEPSNFLPVRPDRDTPPEPVVAEDGASRQPNRLDHMGFLLQLVQVAPMAMSLFGVFLSSVWALRVTTAATLVAGWVAITLLSHGRGGGRDRGRPAQGRPPKGCPASGRRPARGRRHQGRRTARRERTGDAER